MSLGSIVCSEGVRVSGGSRTLFLCEAVPASPSLTRYLVGIGVVGVLVYMCSVGGIVSVVVSRDGVGVDIGLG